MSDAIYFDVSGKELGDTITLNNFDLDKQLKVSDEENTVYAMITNLDNEFIDEAVEENI